MSPVCCYYCHEVLNPGEACVFRRHPASLSVYRRPPDLYELWCVECAQAQIPLARGPGGPETLIEMDVSATWVSEPVPAPALTRRDDEPETWWYDQDPEEER